MWSSVWNSNFFGSAITLGIIILMLDIRKNFNFFLVPLRNSAIFWTDDPLETPIFWKKIKQISILWKMWNHIIPQVGSGNCNLLLIQWTCRGEILKMSCLARRSSPKSNKIPKKFIKKTIISQNPFRKSKQREFLDFVISRFNYLLTFHVKIFIRREHSIYKFCTQIMISVTLKWGETNVLKFRFDCWLIYTDYQWSFTV